MMMIEAHAKINWSLSVLGRQADGYHELDMLMQSVGLCDRLLFEPAGGLSLWSAAGEPITDEKNLIMRAAHIFARETGLSPNVRITVDKQIPQMAGMGGGSADCAATLAALNRIYKTELSGAALRNLGFNLGADVPFCLEGGLIHTAGLGERLETVPNARVHHLLLIQPCGGLSTKAVFEEYDRTQGVSAGGDPVRVAKILEQGEYDKLNQCAGNDLYRPASHLSPAVTRAREDMADSGALYAAMTGSGSAVFGVFDTCKEMENAYERLKNRYSFCKMTKTVPNGLEFIE